MDKALWIRTCMTRQKENLFYQIKYKIDTDGMNMWTFIKETEKHIE